MYACYLRVPYIQWRHKLLSPRFMEPVNFKYWSLYSSLPFVFCLNCSFYNISIPKYTNCEMHHAFTKPIYLISLFRNGDKNSNRRDSKIMSEQSCSVRVYHKIELFSTRSGFIQKNTITNCEICSCAAK